MSVLSRRNVLIGTGLLAGGLVIGVNFTPNRRLADIRQGFENNEENWLTTWVKISADNIVTAVVPHSEMGQGIFTSLPMMLAEELEADWSLVRVEQAPVHELFANNALGKGYLLKGGQLPPFLNTPANWGTYKLSQMMDLQTTGGSTSVRTTGVYGMQVAGAAVKEMLVKAAAKRWSVPARECRAEKSFVYHAASGRSAPFGELAEAASAFEPNPSPKLKDRADYKIIGRSIPRLDIPSKTDGSAVFGLDVTLPDMKVAAIKAAPVFGGRVKSFDKSKVIKRRGVHDVVAIDDAVAVIADNFWRANTALNALPVEFDSGGNENVTTATILDDQRAVLERGKAKKNVEKGNVEAAVASAAKVVEREYQVPFLSHAQMEPLNCTAHVKDGKCEIWVGVQDGLAARAAAAAALGISKSDVTVHVTYLGGAFGRRSGVLMDFIERAVRVAAEVDGPVKVVWSREEDMRQGAYRPASVSRFTAALNEAGMPISWSNRYIRDEEKEAVHIPYAIPNQSIRVAESPNHVPYGVWRSVASSQHGFFIESFIDELAVEAGRDPYAYRRALLAEAPRHRTVLDRVAEMADWAAGPATGRARGIALRESFMSIVAEVAEVSLNEAGDIVVHKVWCAADPGNVVNPDTFIGQMEGGIIFGLTAALYGKITIEEGRAVEGNYPDYEMIRMETCPEIEVAIVESGEPLGGAGEPATPPIAPAVTNAVFALTGHRVRSLPLSDHDLTAAI